MSTPITEVLPGVHHWTERHKGIGFDVSSYWVEPSAALIDPMLPEQGIGWFRERGTQPERILLTNRHHYRHSSRFVEEFGCPVLCNEAGLHEFEDGPEVRGFSFGDLVAPQITALEVGAICPEETALHIALGEGALAIADGLVNWPDRGIAFVPDFLLGDDPEIVKAGLREAYGRLLDFEFGALLFAHGNPITRDGKAALREFLSA